MTAAPGSPVLAMAGVAKSYGALRPLRIASLVLDQGERVSVGGLDAGAGEVLVNLVTGASLPDAGEIRVFGQLTSDIADGDAWLDSLERFGIVSPRAILLDGATLLQNLAMPFTLNIDPVPSDIAERAGRLAIRCGIDRERWLTVSAGELPGDVRVRAHLARALALDPQFVIFEHPTADVDERARRALAADVVGALGSGAIATLVLTNDDEFARAVAPRNLKLDAATGALKGLRAGWLRW